MGKIKHLSKVLMLGFVACMAVTLTGNVSARAVEVDNEIVREMQDITLKTEKFDKIYGDSDFDLLATSRTSTLIYETSNPEVVTVDNVGRAKIQGVGTAVITVIAPSDEVRGYEEARKTITVTVTKRDISGMVPSLSYKNCTYNGCGRKPTVTLTRNNVRLIEGIDYKVTYSNNTNIGTAKVTVKGMNNYMGTVTTTFTINPPKVTGVKQVTYGTSYAGISFTKAKGGVKGYKIYRADSKTGTYKLIKTIDAAKNSYRDTGLKAGKDYYYKVEAYKVVNGKTYVSISATPVKLITKSPKVAVTLTTSKKKITMRWTNATGAQMYEVYIKSSVNGAYKKIKSTTATSFSKTGLVSGKTYYIRVKSYRKDAKGNKIYSETSTTKSIKVK